MAGDRVPDSSIAVDARWPPASESVEVLLQRLSLLLLLLLLLLLRHPAAAPTRCASRPWCGEFLQLTIRY